MTPSGWTYCLRTGALTLDGTGFDYRGYSGWGPGKNNPGAQRVEDVGPIPCGDWRIVGPPCEVPERGPYVLRLEPFPGTDTYGRAGFLLHGDSVEHPGNASHGCIVLPRWAREAVWASGIRRLTVVAEPPAPTTTV